MLAASALFTAVVVAAPFLRLAYENLSLHVALETAEALIGALLAYLSLGRYRTTHSVRDLALTTAFAVVAVTNLLLSALPVVALESRPVGFVAWAAAALRLGGATAFCVAAVATPREVHVRARTVAVSAVTFLLAVAVIAAAADVGLADAIDPTLSPSASNRPRLVGHPVVLAVQLAGVVLYGMAALGFLRRARPADELVPWLAAGAVAAAFARVHYFLFPSLYSEWVYTGDLLRLASYLLFLVGAAREIRAFWEARAVLAAVEERERLARDLHDGLVQELSFIRSQTAGSTVLEGERLSYVAEAAERALVESRSALDALSSVASDRLDAVLRQVAEEVAGRAGARVEIEVADGIRPPPAVHRAMVGIVREATTNAVRHGRARSIRVAVALEDGVARLFAVDDGTGFDPSTAPSGFGLRSMSERARLAGGSLEVRSAPGEGTVVSAAFPGE